MKNRREFIKQAAMLGAGVAGGVMLAKNAAAQEIAYADPSSAVNPDEMPVKEAAKKMKIVIGSDHAGYALKLRLLPALKKMGHQVTDVGSYDPNPVDFPDICLKIGDAILNGEAERGIVFCGTGVGAALACNKIPGLRAAVCHDIFSAHQCVEHDDVQVMTLGNQIIGYSVALEHIQAFLAATFLEDEQFRRRVQKVEMLGAQRKRR